MNFDTRTGIVHFKEKTEHELFSVTKLIKQYTAEAIYYFLRVYDNLKSFEPSSFWV